MFDSGQLTLNILHLDTLTRHRPTPQFWVVKIDCFKYVFKVSHNNKCDHFKLDI